MPSQVELAEMIRSLRSELQTARDEGVDEGLRFKVDEVELEVQVEVHKEDGAEGGVKFYVFNAKAGGKDAERQVQRIRLKLTPLGDGTIAATEEEPRPPGK